VFRRAVRKKQAENAELKNFEAVSLKYMYEIAKIRRRLANNVTMDVVQKKPVRTTQVYSLN
jgi:hypothetical protein